MWWEKDKCVLKYFAGVRFGPPSSTGRDGIAIYGNMLVDNEYPEIKFIPGRLIEKALKFAYSMRTGFIRGDYCWSLPEWKIEEIHHTEFKYMLELLLEEQK